MEAKTSCPIFLHHLMQDFGAFRFFGLLGGRKNRHEPVARRVNKQRKSPARGGASHMTGTSERQVPAGKLSRASSLVYGRSLCVDFSRLNRATRWRLAGGRAYNPSSFGIGAEPGHQENRRPRTSVPTEASGWRSTVRRSIARLPELLGKPASD
jgi:hypothetical protein